VKAGGSLVPSGWRVAVMLLLLLVVVPLVLTLPALRDLVRQFAPLEMLLSFWVFGLPFVIVPLATAALLYLVISAAVGLALHMGLSLSCPWAALLGIAAGTLLLWPFWNLAIAAVFGGLFGGLFAVLAVPPPEPVQLIWEDDDV
jgi:hypothetical protein